MASQGPFSSYTITSDGQTGSILWNDPQRASVSDDIRANFNPATGPTTSHYLKARNFGFNIPPGATIDGVVVEIETTGGANSRDKTVQLTDQYGRVVGQNKATNTAPGVESYKTYGGITDTWQLSLTSEIINNSNFGVVFQAEALDPSVGNSLDVDHIRITVYYTGGTFPAANNWLLNDSIPTSLSQEFYAVPAAWTPVFWGPPMMIFVSVAGVDYEINLGDTLSLADAIAKEPNIIISESMSLAEAIAKEAGLNFAETVSLADAISRELGKNLTEALALADTISLVAETILTDSVSLIDEISKEAGLVFGDSVSLSDTFAALATFELTFGETVTLTDVVVKETGLNFTDAFALVDQISKEPQVVLGDTVSLAESVSNELGLGFAESLTLVDAIAKELVLNFADNLSLTDSESHTMGDVLRRMMMGIGR